MADHAFQVLTSMGGDKFLFASMTGEETLGRPHRFDAVVLSEDGDIEAADLLGTDAGISYTDPDGEERNFSGLVAGFGYLGIRDRYFAYRLTLRPWIWFLNNAANCKIFQEMSIPDIVKDVFRAAGFTDFEEKLTGSYSALEYCVQYNETDFDFCHRLMERAGIYYYVDHTKAAHNLVLIDSPTSHSDNGKVTFQDATLNQPIGNRVIDWTTETIPRPGSVMLESYTFTNPKSELKTSVSNPAGHSEDSGEVYLYSGLYEQTGDGDSLAKTRLEAFAAQHARRMGRGTAAAALLPGYTFTLEDHPRQAENSDYLILGARYTLHGHAYRTGAEEGGRLFFEAEFEAMDKTVPFRLPPETPIPRIPGPQTAVVVGKAGEEIWTDKYGRVKVQFHWDLEGKKDEKSSCWVRVAQRWSGAKWGSQMLPRIGHEVIVDFINGDPDQPLVTGSVYNDDNKPAFDLPANQTQSGVKSQTVKGSGFNEFRFEDKSGEEEIYLHAQKDMTGDILNDLTMTVTNNETRTVEVDRTTTIKGKETVTVEKDRTSTIKGKDDLTVEKSATTTVTETLDVTSKQDMTLTSNSKITLKVGGSSIELTASGVTIKATSITLEAQGSLTAKATGSTSVQGGTTEVKGSMTTVSADGILTAKGALVKIN